jgi:hypothetical protein
MPCRHGGGTALLIVILGARCGWEVNTTPRKIYPQKTSPVPIVQETLWTERLVRKVVEKRKSNDYFGSNPEPSSP